MQWFVGLLVFVHSMPLRLCLHRLARGIREVPTPEVSVRVQEPVWQRPFEGTIFG